MDGVTILNTYSTYSDGWAAILSVGIIGGLLLFIAAVTIFRDGEILIGFILTAMIVLIVIGCMKIPQTTYYEAVVDSSVSWKQLSDKYKVIKIRRQIITLVERQGE